MYHVFCSWYLQINLTVFCTQKFNKRMPPEAVDLVSRLLQYSPNLRCTAVNISHLLPSLCPNASEELDTLSRLSFSIGRSVYCVETFPYTVHLAFLVKVFGCDFYLFIYLFFCFLNYLFICFLFSTTNPSAFLWMNNE